MDVSLAGLRVLRETAERGTFTAAAVALGYTQSAVSRQVAGLERAVGTPLFERRPEGPVLTRAGRVLLRRARAALDEVDAGLIEIAGADPGARVRLGVIPSAGPVVLPRALVALGRTRPDVEVTTRTGTTPALARALRAGAIDVALLASRPPYRPIDAESPPLRVRVLAEQALLVALPADDPLAAGEVLDPAELVERGWIATPSRSDEPQLGVWPSLPGRPRVLHTAVDWATKLHLVAAGRGVTTVPPSLVEALPSGVRALPVAGPPEVRRIVTARPPGPDARDVGTALDALVEVLRSATQRDETA